MYLFMLVQVLGVACSPVVVVETWIVAAVTTAAPVKLRPLARDGRLVAFQWQN